MIFFIDFEDSFSYNIIAYLKLISKVKIIHYKVFSELPINNKEQYIILLGPGPGHVNEYLKYFKRLKEHYINKKCFLTGICLGHQVILNDLFSYQVKQIKFPQHGRSCYLIEDGQKTEYKVQQYNSWYIDIEEKITNKKILFNEYGELASFSNGKNLYTVQFHPESIGTTCPEIFFDPLKEFLSYSTCNER